MDKGKCLSYIDSYKKFKASRICVQWCIIIGLLIKKKKKINFRPQSVERFKVQPPDLFQGL